MNQCDRQVGGLASIQSKVVTTITDYHWDFEVATELVAYAGTGENEEDRIVVQVPVCLHTPCCTFQLRRGPSCAPAVPQLCPICASSVSLLLYLTWYPGVAAPSCRLFSLTIWITLLKHAQLQPCQGSPSSSFHAIATTASSSLDHGIILTCSWHGITTHTEMCLSMLLVSNWTKCKVPPMPSLCTCHRFVR